MNCSYLRARLSAYIDGELAGSEMLALRSHISRCPGCRTEEQELRAMKRLMGAMPDVVPPADFEDRLLRAVRTRRPRVSLWHRLRIAPLAAACAAAATIFAVTVLRPEEKQPVTVESRPAPTFDLSRDQEYASASDALTLGPVALPAGHASQ